MMYTINKNTQFNSLEISFDGKPEQTIIDGLKNLKFRWHSIKKLWFGFSDEKTIKNLIDNNIKDNTINFDLKVVIGSWKAYNECNKRSLGSSWINLKDFESVEDVKNELIKQGFTNQELEETFIHDYEIDGIDDDILVFTNCDLTSYSQAFNRYQEIKQELANKKEVIIPQNNNSNILKLKSLIIIENDEEKHEILKKHYSGSYLDYMKNSTEKSKKLFYKKNILDGSIVLKTTDNYIITISNEKPSISSDLWYDDETDAPTNNYANFENYNLNHLNIKNIADDKLVYLYKTQYDDESSFTRNYYANDKDEIIRELTQDEKNDIISIKNMLIDNFKKRLSSYWKKYQNKISWCGYWVNR